jgi:hypothetical protein
MGLTYEVLHLDGTILSPARRVRCCRHLLTIAMQEKRDDLFGHPRSPKMAIGH